MFISATLTVIGFAVHDTITVFDRIRENMLRHAGEPIEDIINHSLTQTLVRSLSTGMCVSCAMAPVPTTAMRTPSFIASPVHCVDGLRPAYLP